LQKNLKILPNLGKESTKQCSPKIKKRVPTPTNQLNLQQPFKLLPVQWEQRWELEERQILQVLFRKVYQSEVQPQ